MTDCDESGGSIEDDLRVALDANKRLAAETDRLRAVVEAAAAESAALANETANRLMRDRAWNLAAWLRTEATELDQREVDVIDDDDELPDVEILIAELTACHDGAARTDRKRVEAEAEVRRLRAAVEAARRFIDHRPECAVHADYPCDCGLDELFCQLNGSGEAT